MKQTCNPRKPVLLVDDEQHILTTTKLFLQGSGINEVLTVSDSREVLPLLAAHPVSVIVLDLHMPHLSGRELLPKINRDFPHIPVIMMTAIDEIETVVECMKSGAFDYLVKPVDSGRLVACVQKAMDMCDLSSELSSLKQRLLTDRLDHPAAFSPIVTCNKKMRALFQYIEVVAATRQPIMITGETGSGKELVARAIHDLSGCKGEFVAVNVAGLDDPMFSDTLFGHKKGAFTGADQAREGLIARAGGGTLFLDEIGDLNEMSQIKLLRLLQEREYYPVGSDITLKSDARILLASNRDLQKLIAAGKFRNDLYYRLCAHQVRVPSLRERLDDIPVLLDHFLAKAAASLGKKKPTPPPELATLLSVYNFPGNVRELEALVYDAVVRHTSGVLSMESFRSVIGGDHTPPCAAPLPVGDGDNPLYALFGRFPTVQDVVDYMVEEAMKLANGNQGIAASLLGISRQTLNKRLQEKSGA
ncbi:MAG: sigma-54 dependent DNA-binding response [Geobacteraceae bacterium]|nr:MAG: sigma-54 dependent DNA-binding response [Geobacteraceae bacterium]